MVERERRLFLHLFDLFHRTCSITNTQNTWSQVKFRRLLLYFHRFLSSTVKTLQPLITRKDLGSWIKFLRCDHELIKELERLSARFIYRLD